MNTNREILEAARHAALFRTVANRNEFVVRQLRIAIASIDAQLAAL